LSPDAAYPLGAGWVRAGLGAGNDVVVVGGVFYVEAAGVQAAGTDRISSIGHSLVGIVPRVAGDHPTGGQRLLEGHATEHGQ
jgi:hypothetical protein